MILETRSAGLSARIVRPLPGFDLDVTLAVPPGSILVLAGPSGSGKSTLLRCLAGLDQPKAGQVALSGRTLFDAGRGVCLPPRKRRLGLVFQDHPLFPHLTLWQNVAYAAKDRRQAHDLLDRFGIARLGGRKPSDLSGGERQRGAICQALAARPEALLLDEPFSALDQSTRLTLRQELRDLRDSLQLPVIHVTHDLAEALALGDDILAIRNGRPDPNWLQTQLALAANDAALLAAGRNNAQPLAVLPQALIRAARPIPTQ